MHFTGRAFTLSVKRITNVSLRFNGYFFRWTWVSQYQNVAFWIRLELRMMKVVVTGAINRCTKLQSNRYHQQTNTLLFTDWMPFLSPSQQCQSTEQNVLPMSLSHTILTAIFQVNLG